MTKNEALKLALEALEESHPEAYRHTITAIKKALAQPEQEPVGWAEHGVINWLADKQFNHTSFLYATPPQRTWVGLTDEEIKGCFKITPDQHLPWHIYQRIEAKLKEKNHGQ